MGLEAFESTDDTADPTDSDGPSTSGVDEFMDNIEDSEDLEIEGGFTISPDNDDDRDTEVVKIFGGPGTGKTTTMVGNTDIEDFKGILQRLFKERHSDEVILIAYTRAAADEAKDRLVKLTDVTKTKADDRITTIHSMAMRFNNLKPKDIVEIRWANDKKNFCNEVGMEFKEENDDEEEMMAVPDDEGHLFFQMLGWLKSKLKDPTQMEDCPLAANWPRSEDKFVEFANEWEDYKNRKGIWEFDDAILECVLNGDTIDTKFLFIDEVQDLYPLQQKFIDNQFGHVKRIFLAGDDDQCLPEGETINIYADGDITSRNIEDVKVGDAVVSCVGKGEAITAEVTDTFSREVSEQRFINLTTESGKSITVTDNHKLIARSPRPNYDHENISSTGYYVYLMEDRNSRYRVGVTKNLSRRLDSSSEGKCMIPLLFTESKEEALIQEQIYSAKYSLPTSTFINPTQKTVSSDKLMSALYSEVDTRQKELQEVFVDKAPVWSKQSTTGEPIINITKCADSRKTNSGIAIDHRLHVVTEEDSVTNALLEFSELNSKQESEHKWTFRTQSTDFQKIGSIAKRIKSEVGGDIVTQMVPTEGNRRATVTPAANIAEGMLVPVYDDGQVVYEEVVSISEYTDTTRVYDLTVTGPHNFASNGVFISNTIYEWAGAKPEYFLEMDGKINDEMPELWEDKTGYWQDEGVYILDQSWRMPDNILELAKMAINKVDERQDKQIKPHHEGGEFIPLRKPDSERVVQLINPEDTMVLFRAKYQMQEFGKDLIGHGVPFKDRFKTWKDDVVKLRNALGAIKNEESKMGGGEAAKLVKELPDKALKSPSRRSRLEDRFSSQDTVGTDTVVSKCRYDYPGSYAEIMRWCAEFKTDDMHYYRTEAVKNNIAKHKEHLNPKGIEIETIHGSKGREADTIVLSTDTTESVQESMPPNGMTDAERRLYYVGMTRTKNRLVMCEGIDNQSPQIKLDTILGKEWREMYDWANGPVHEPHRQT